MYVVLYGMWCMKYTLVIMEDQGAYSYKTVLDLAYVVLYGMWCMKYTLVIMEDQGA